MKNIIIAVTAIILVGGGCSIDSNKNESSTSLWQLEGNNLETISAEVAPWATHTFSEGTGTAFGSGPSEASKVRGDLVLVATYPTRVIDIPKGRSVEGYPEPVEPSDFVVFVLKDEEGKLFRAYVQSFDGESFKVTTFGPALDRSTGTGLETWPAEQLQDEAAKSNAQMVMIPYPYPMNQVYYQYGSDIESARLVNVESGVNYDGLPDLLDSIEADWASLE